MSGRKRAALTRTSIIITGGRAVMGRRRAVLVHVWWTVVFHRGSWNRGFTENTTHIVAYTT